MFVPKISINYYRFEVGKNLSNNQLRKIMLTKALPWITLFYMGSVWGLSFSLGKIAVNLGGTPIGIAFWSSLFAGIILLILTTLRRRYMKFSSKNLFLFIILAMIGTAIPSVCFYYAASKIPAGVLAITVTLVPILTYAFATFLGLEKLAARRVLGILLGASAILFLVVPETSLPDRSAVIWILVACISSVCYASENIVLAVRDLEGIGPIRMACGMSLIGTLLLGIVGLSTNNLFMISIPFNNLSWIILGLAVINVTAYTLFIYTISQSGPLFASQVGYLVTLSGIFWGILLFGESNSIWVWASLLTMLIGLAFVTPKKSDSKQEAVK